MHVTVSRALADILRDNAHVAKRRPLPREARRLGLAEAMAASRGLKTQSALARKAGVAQSTVGRLLRGEVDPQSETAQRLAEALRIPI